MAMQTEPRAVWRVKQALSRSTEKALGADPSPDFDKLRALLVRLFDWPARTPGD